MNAIVTFCGHVNAILYIEHHVAQIDVLNKLGYKSLQCASPTKNTIKCHHRPFVLQPELESNPISELNWVNRGLLGIAII